MKRILVPCDFSVAAQNAYTFALDIAKKVNSEVFVLKVIDLPFMYESPLAGSTLAFDPQLLLKDLEDDAIARFKRMKVSHSFQHDVSFNVTQGAVTPAILKSIKDHNIDLVVMGTQGTSGLSEVLIGSNTEKIVRTSPVPVLAVRKAVNLASIHNLVFPTGMEIDQPHVIQKLKELQAFFKAQVHVLMVNTPHNLKRTSDQRALMEDHARRLGLENSTINIRESFYEQEGILDFVKEIGADMIAMGTHGRRGLAHLFHGSIAEDVVNHVEVPIWTCSMKSQL